MKSNRLSFDFTDEPELVELLRAQALSTRTSQKGILIEALKNYFSERLDTALLYRKAERTFAEWDNEEDEVYNKL